VASPLRRITSQAHIMMGPFYEVNRSQPHRRESSTVPKFQVYPILPLEMPISCLESDEYSVFFRSLVLGLVTSSPMTVDRESAAPRTHADCRLMEKEG
jgi:hypothetical protein